MILTLFLPKIKTNFTKKHQSAIVDESFIYFLIDQVIV